MSEFDKFIKTKIKEENRQIPDSVKSQIEQTLSSLPEQEQKVLKFELFPKIMTIAACFIFVFLVVLPNCSTVYAKALEEIPVIGNIVEVVTIRNYFYSDRNHEMDIDVPKIEGNESQAADYINKDVDELTKILVDRFNTDLEEIGDKGHSGIYVDYEVVTNTENWFTLKICVHEAAGSSNTYYKYYHIDKRDYKIITLKDLFSDNEYSTVLENELRRQMNIEMAGDNSKIYWTENAEIGQDFVKLSDEHNFYWSENGDLVIVFDKYEVAPGYMGTPEFVIEKELLSDILKSEYK